MSKTLHEISSWKRFSFSLLQILPKYSAFSTAEKTRENRNRRRKILRDGTGPLNAEPPVAAAATPIY
jgi:hypothetical protein